MLSINHIEYFLIYSKSCIQQLASKTGIKTLYLLVLVVGLSTYMVIHCTVEQNLTSKKFPRETEGAISTSATRWFENWSYFHFWLASKREAQYLSLEMSYSKNFKNGNFLHLMTQLLIIHNFFQNSAHQVKKLGFRRPQKNLFFGLFSTFSIANIKSCQ